jgi:N-acetylglucosamine-6-phosphate deacetylase
MKIIDIHTHGMGGLDTQSVSEGHILGIADIHGRNGVSEIIPTIYPANPETMRDNMLAVKKAMEKQKSIENDSARIIGMHLEGPFLNPEKCGALTGGAFLQPDEYIFKKLVEGLEDEIKIITIAPEREGATRLIRSISDSGIIASMGHSDATYAEAEAGYQAGARGITHIFNSMRGIYHREPGIAGFGLLDKDIFIEVIADPFHLDPAIIELIFSVKKRDRIILVSDTVKESGTGEDAPAVRNHNNRLLGGCMTVKEAAERLIQKGYDKEVIMKCISSNPEKYLTLYTTHNNQSGSSSKPLNAT